MQVHYAAEVPFHLLIVKLWISVPHGSLKKPVVYLLVVLLMKLGIKHCYVMIADIGIVIYGSIGSIVGLNEPVNESYVPVGIFPDGLVLLPIENIRLGNGEMLVVHEPPLNPVLYVLNSYGIGDNGEQILHDGSSVPVWKLISDRLKCFLKRKENLGLVKIRKTSVSFYNFNVSVH